MVRRHESVNRVATIGAFTVLMTAGTLIALQLALMHALAYAQGHHLAYFVISLALLGFGAGGTMVAVWQRRGADPMPETKKPGGNAADAGHGGKASGTFALGLGALGACVVAIAWLPAATYPLLGTLDVHSLLSDQYALIRAVALGGLWMLPFLLGSVVLAVAFMESRERIGRLYGADLLGSAVGAGALLWTLNHLTPERIPGGLAIALLPALIPPVARSWRAHPPVRWLFAGVLLLAAAGAWRSTELPLSPYKDLSYARLLPEARLHPTRPHARGPVDRVVAPQMRFAPDLSLHFAGEVPLVETLFVNAEAAAVRFRENTPPESRRILEHTPRALPFVLFEDRTRRILLLESDGEPAVAQTRAHGAEVVAQQAHPAIAEILETGGWADAGVRVEVAGSRRFLARTEEAFDGIVFPAIGQFGGPRGFHALDENHLFTREALEAAWERLNEGGWLAFAVWLDAPPRHSLRLLALVGGFLRANGLPPPEHVAALRGWNSMAVVLSRKPPDADALARLGDFANAAGFDVIWPVAARTGTPHHADEDGWLERGFEALFAEAAAGFIASYRFDIRPPTDDRPFFGQFLRLRDLLPVSAGAAAATEPDLRALSLAERGWVLVGLSFILLGGAAVLLIIAPLVRRRFRTGASLPLVLYFSGIGAGFMFFEIALIHRLTLIWGHPLTSVAVVLALLLVGMGIGSLNSGRLKSDRRTLAAILLAAAATIPAVLWILAALEPWAMSGGEIPRFVLSLALLLPSAFLLGHAFPLGLRLITRSDATDVPWAWGVNGCLSVITAPMAALVALSAGYTVLGWLGAAAYLLSLTAVVAFRR